MVGNQLFTLANEKRLVFVVNGLSCQVCSICLLRRNKQTKVLAFSIHFYLSLPLALRLANAKKPTLVVCVRASLILTILHWCCVAQISPTVIAAYTIDVIYMMLRPFACHVQPRQPMRQVITTKDLYPFVSIGPKPSGHIAGALVLGWAHRPSEHARHCVINEH